MATDDAIAGPDAHATRWPCRPPVGTGLGGAGVTYAKAPGRAETPCARLAAPWTPQLAIAGSLDFLGLPALIVDSLGRVLEANRAVHLTLTEGLSVANGRLSARSHRVCIDLRNLVMQAASARTMPPVVIPRSDRHPLLVYAFPFMEADSLPVGRAIVIVVDLGRSATPPAPHLRHVFGLTAAQSRLAALLANGTDLEAAAKMLGISKETARGHLRAIFARTGVRRQSELVALIARLLPSAPQSPESSIPGACQGRGAALEAAHAGPSGVGSRPFPAPPARCSARPAR